MDGGLKQQNRLVCAMAAVQWHGRSAPYHDTEVSQHVLDAKQVVHQVLWLGPGAAAEGVRLGGVVRSGCQLSLHPAAGRAGPGGFRPGDVAPGVIIGGSPASMSRPFRSSCKLGSSADGGYHGPDGQDGRHVRRFVDHKAPVLGPSQQQS